MISRKIPKSSRLPMNNRTDFAKACLFKKGVNVTKGGQSFNPRDRAGLAGSFHEMAGDPRTAIGRV